MKVIDLFCGGGGLSSGFDEAGFDIIAGVDHEGAFEDTFRHNHDSRFLEADLSDISGQGILDQLGYDSGDLDGVIGGTPLSRVQFGGCKNGTR